MTTPDNVPWLALTEITVRGEIPLLPNFGLPATVAAGTTTGVGFGVELALVVLGVVRLGVVGLGAVVPGVAVVETAAGVGTAGTVTLGEGAAVTDGAALVGAGDFSAVEALLVHAASSAPARTIETAIVIGFPRMSESIPPR